MIKRASGGFLAIGIHGTATQSYMSMLALNANGGADNTAFGGTFLRDVGPTGNDFAYTSTRFNGKLLLVGDGDNGGGTNDDITVALVDEAGALDTSFGTGGYLRIDLLGMTRADTSEGVTVAGTDVVVWGVKGYDIAQSQAALVRLSANGTPVAGFGTSGVVVDDYLPNVQDECNDVTTVGSRIVAVGRTGQRIVIAAYTNAGVRDTTFAAPNGYAVFGSAFAQAYGVTNAGGDVVAVGESNGEGMVVRLAGDGSPRATFGTNGVTIVTGTEALFYALPQPNGKLLVSGQNGTTGIVARLMPDGSLDTSFGTAGRVQLNVGSSLTFQGMMLDGNELLVVGTSSATTPRTAVIARYD